VDPIVRIQAGRLRRSLERYYLLSGRADALRVELPRGTYVPTFHPQAEPAAPTAAEEQVPEPPPPVVLEDDWPVVVIEAFEASAQDPGSAEAAMLVTEELVLELGRYRDVRALLQRELERLDPSRRERARFALAGRVRGANGDQRVSARLVDRTTGEQIWGDEYHTAAQPGRWSGRLEDVARVVAARVGAEEGVVMQLLAAERRKRPPAAITPYGAILLSYEFFLARDPQSVPRVIEALRGVVKADPDCAVAWTRLARVCLANYAFEVSQIPTPIDDTITYAHHGVRVDPVSRRARCILAAALMVKGEVDSAKSELEEALRLSPDSLVYLEIVGYLLTLLGEGERGVPIIRSARERNPHTLPNATMGFWFEHLRRGDVQLAYQAAPEYRDPTFFWRPVMRASCLGLLGRHDEAAVEVSELLQRKPDFEARGRTLVGYYVKLPDVLERVVEGLRKAGLTLV
jgi:TolB-like protein